MAEEPLQIYRDLFLEVAIVEHLSRARVEKLGGLELTVGQFGVLNYFQRLDIESDQEGVLAWAFQDEEAVMAAKIDALVSLGYVLTEGERPQRRIRITPKGEAARQRSLEAIQREVRPLIQDIPLEDAKVALSVLRELRRTLDNLPDR